MELTTEKAAFIDRYDQTILHPLTREQYGGTGYYNVGLWSRDAGSLEDASAALIDELIAIAGPGQPGERILDIGCGLGASTARIAKAFPEADMCGVNISAAQIEHARQMRPDLDFLVADAAELALPPASVDKMFAVESVFHFDTRDDFLRRASAALKPGCRLVMTDVLFTPDSSPWEWWAPAANRSLTLDGYEDACARAGFTVERLEDATRRTWTPFCAAIRAAGRESADRIESWVSHYLIVSLKAGGA